MRQKTDHYVIGRKKWKQRPANPMVILEKTTKQVETMQALHPSCKPFHDALQNEKNSR